MSELLALLLLQDLSRSCFLPGKAVTLSGLMEVLLTLSCPIRLLKRGDQVGNIQVLWPQKTRLRKDLEETLGEIGIPRAVYEQDRWMWKELVQVAARMREIFMRLVALSGMEEIPRNGEHIPVELEEEVRGFRADFRKLRRNERFLGMAERFQESVELLRTFHDRTGLIFHVGEDGKENFLYTGNGWKEWAVWLEKMKMDSCLFIGSTGAFRFRDMEPMNATGISHHMHRGISLFPTGMWPDRSPGKFRGVTPGCLLSRALLCTAQVLTGARATKTESVAAGMLRSHLLSFVP